MLNQILPWFMAFAFGVGVFAVGRYFQLAERKKSRVGGPIEMRPGQKREPRSAASEGSYDLPQQSTRSLR